MCRAILGIALLCTTGCAQSRLTSRTAPPPLTIELAAHIDAPQKRTIYVTSNGFHTGLVLRREDVPREAWPEVDATSAHEWVEVGWGSEIFYRAKKITVPVVVGAIVPNASVLHVVGWDESPEVLLAGGDVIRLHVDEARFCELCRYLHDSYALDAAGRPQNLGPGIYGDSTFFRARGKYYFPNTCNVWTARGLKLAGVPVIPELCGTADPVLAATRNVGETIHRR